MNPFAAFLLIQGIETLSLRAQRHSENAFALAQWLSKHEKSHESPHHCHQRANEFLCPNAFGGVLKRNISMASTVVDSLKLASHLANSVMPRPLSSKLSSGSHLNPGA
ncbi:hypothetical protein BDR07DRAFT_1462325 [Suillus spraguei]|nr:hypothetical protein BDR07DRAFT_1462325 [Suillus spraguei]